MVNNKQQTAIKLHKNCAVQQDKLFYPSLLVIRRSGSAIPIIQITRIIFSPSGLTEEFELSVKLTSPGRVIIDEVQL